MSKQKSKLAKLANSNDEKVYETTEYDCRVWFNILNKEIFDNTLSPIHDVDIRWRRKCHAYYEVEVDRDTKDCVYTKLSMNRKYRSKKTFVEVLGHELVHHYQALYNEPLGHGPSFFEWSDKFSKKGLKLLKEY